MARIGVKVEATEENTTQRDFSNLPNGDYVLELTAGDVKVKNEGTRDQTITLSVTIDVIEPEDLKGRKLFGNYNLEHPKAQAQEIGQKQFACLLRALGMTEAPEDSDDLLFKSFMAKVGMGNDSKDLNADGTPKYAARNELKKYYYPDEGDMPEAKVDAPPTAANDNRPAATPAARPAAASGERPKTPWGAKK